MKSRWPLHLAALVLLAFAIGTLFLREPGFGDDFTYWSFAFDLHERGLDAWQRESFHDLRWPVWGVSWLLQAIFGQGLLSFYGVPLLYLGAGAALAFTFARLITRSLPIAWTAGIVFLFHPLLDTVSYRPMPDLSEAVWGGATVLCWWMLMRSATRGKSVLWAALTGLCVYISESNRLTGVFIVPVLLVGTLLYARQRFGWLVLAGVFSALFYTLECAFYYDLFGNWFHNLTANLGGKGKKGTEAIAFWYLPFRFIDTLWKGNLLAPLYCLLTLLGIWVAWSSDRVNRWLVPPSELALDARNPVIGPPLSRVMIVWFVVLYLEYACAPQKIWPWRPLIRDADRFLCGLTIPMAVLTAIGAAMILRQPWVRRYHWARATIERPLLLGAIAVVLCALVSSREFFSLGFIPEMRRYVRSVPEGTKVFTHHAMRAFTFLVDAKTAPRLVWLTENKILHQTPRLEKLAKEAQEFWYVRKLVWLTTRKNLEQKAVGAQEPLASYFEFPERDWAMTQLLAKGDTPDLIFNRRRTPQTPAPIIITPDAPELAGKLLPLPFEWHRKDGLSHTAFWKIPETFRGQLVRVEIEAASEDVEAFTARMRLSNGNSPITEYVLKPYLHPAPGKEFFAFQIPAEADTCQIDFKMAKAAKLVRFSGFRIVLQPASSDLAQRRNAELK